MREKDANAESVRLADARTANTPWKKWGPYLSERQWGTVREDYSQDGNAWDYFSHDHARSRAYHWGEDGLAGISDDKQFLCFSLALWNGRDPILKERLFGLTNSEANHGEDVKEYYFYLDSTPTHSYMKYLYKYPQAVFPYGDLISTNRQRSRNDMEYELLDTGAFNDDRYFDVFVEYAKNTPEDILVQISVCNRGPEAATIHVVPTLWFRNTWTWWPGTPKPSLTQVSRQNGTFALAAAHPEMGERFLYCDNDVPLLFTENETNNERIFGTPNDGRFVKDGINDYVVAGTPDAVNPEHAGTKASAHHQLTVKAGKTATIRLRLSNQRPAAVGDPFGSQFAQIVETRRREADEFYRSITPARVSEDEARVMRQALAGMLWGKQYFFFDVDKWLSEHGEDPMEPGARFGRNSEWVPHGESAHHLDARQVGVPVVRRLGPGVPYHRSLRSRRGFRPGTARLDATGVFHSSVRSDPGLRVELQRCQSARSRLGDDISVPDRTGLARQRRRRVSRAVVFEADAELQLVGKPKRPVRQESL
jgi:hypothetical protein